MWKALNTTWNRLWNTVAIAPRMAWTAVTTATDLWNTIYTFHKEGYEVLADTTQKIKSTLLWAWNHGKWYHKAMNIPLSPVIATWAALEWVVRSTVQPIVNGVVNVWNTGKNTIKNARRGSFWRVFSKKPISDFSYDHVKTKELKKNNRISKWQFGRWKWKESETEGAPQIERKIEKKIKKEEKKVVVEEKKEETKVEKIENKEEEIEKSEDVEDLSNIKTLTEMADHLWVKETENMVKHRQDVIKQMELWKPIKNDLIKYEDGAREIVGKYQWDNFARWNIAIDLLKADMINEGMKTISNEDKKYKKDLQDYLQENLDAAKSHLRNTWDENSEKIVNKITWGNKKKWKKIKMDNSKKDTEHAIAA